MKRSLDEAEAQPGELGRDLVDDEVTKADHRQHAKGRLRWLSKIEANWDLPAPVWTQMGRSRSWAAW